MKLIVKLLGAVLISLITACIGFLLILKNVEIIASYNTSGNIGSILQGTLGVAVALGGSLVAIAIADTANQTIKRQDIHERTQPYKESVQTLANSISGLRYEFEKIFSLNKKIAFFIVNISEVIKERKKVQEKIIKSEIKNCHFDELPKMISDYIRNLDSKHKKEHLDNLRVSWEEYNDPEYNLESHIMRCQLKGLSHEETHKKLYRIIRNNQINYELEKSYFSNMDVEVEEGFRALNESLNSLSNQLQECSKNRNFCKFLDGIIASKSLAEKLPVEVYEKLSVYIGEKKPVTREYSNASNLLESLISLVSLMKHRDSETLMKCLYRNFTGDIMKVFFPKPELDYQQICTCQLLAFGMSLGSEKASPKSFINTNISEGAFLLWFVANATILNQNNCDAIMMAIKEIEKPDEDLDKVLEVWIKSHMYLFLGEFDISNKNILDCIEKMWGTQDLEPQI